MYSLICKGVLRTPKNYDLQLILSVYNFGFWFNGRDCFIQLDDYGDSVALVSVSGDYAIYSRSEGSRCSTLTDRLKKILGMDEDLTGFYKLAENDALLNCFAKRYIGWRPRSTSLWWGLVIGICQQNASFRQGWGILYNMIKVYGRKASINGKEYPLIPTPQDILENPDLLIKAKAGYRSNAIILLARHFNSIEERVMKEGEPEKIELILRSVKGIGPYTARLAMVLGLRKYELPPIDRWLRRLISKAYYVNERLAEMYWTHIWGKYSGLAALATTIALDAVPLRKALERLKRNELCPVEDPNMFSPMNLWRHLK